ncbi:MAG: hypothetical protein HUU10_01470 [Bacteroidetes bacterium]|nr:hypothetical protein [Bacteroidota bacterium]
MNILFLSGAYYKDRRLLDTAGKWLKPITGPLLIIPAPDFFWGSDGLPLKEISRNPLQFHEIYNRSLIDRLGSAMLPAISLMASDRGMLTVRETGEFELHPEKIRNLTGNGISLVITPIIRQGEQITSCSLVEFIRSLHHPAVSMTFLSPLIPPPGISSVRELMIWSQSDDQIRPSFEWLNPWPAGLSITLADDFSIRLAGSEPGLLLSLKA